jgi:hypothetical protein
VADASAEGSAAVVTVFAVFKVGVYRHECAGIFTDVEVAKRTADAVVAVGDGYHVCEVVPFEVDVPSEVLKRDDVREAAAVYVSGDGRIRR